MQDGADAVDRLRNYLVRTGEGGIDSGDPGSMLAAAWAAIDSTEAESTAAQPGGCQTACSHGR